MNVTTKQSSILLIVTGLGVILLATATMLVLIQDESSTRLEALKRRQQEQDKTDPLSPPPAVRVEATRRAVLAGGIIDMSIQRFRLRMGRYPSSLDDLVNRPENLSPSEHWDGPYINNARLIVDPWDRRYQYLSPGAHNPSGYDLWSTGPDSLSQTADDIGNW